ncbi:protein involved in rRNA processing [Scheffersomyces stipitis CBS 6054]|uniref:Pre-rRNA-processing protein IPI1 n=1 Tax=Scheffersomyces stipitis (strain ATCC 58785 / CBS 6054 / NBRC 10063 / NRRL Y-11545) TaxID=322104 RepID=IPI1_PICST|nr:protein involved in rRNA processing [Scheffersomyces stipitis CBS 6054]A3M0B1.2 RecName: Full=Pre-rRNA-processing protein IPI1 [Scheffersomyces stipitis CBS 6054]ABN68682.2 protein involved in rRNA processing [Scheffersomyces stipitis CBS 6054]
MATKRKKAQKAKDFVKPKLKVGKTAAKPDNHTDTSFTAKTISLPNQSIAKKSKSGVSEEQKQEIDLSHHLSLTKHHASATRKEVLIYIDQHLPSNPSLYKQIFTSIIPLILDQSASVRTTLVALFNKCANMQPGILELHIRSIALFIHSAMTHLHPEIRNSSTKFLNVLVEHAPQSLSKSFFVKTMRSYFTLMSWTLTDDKKSVSLAITTSAAIGGSVKKARIGHLAVLKAFLQASLFPQLSDSAESEINPAIVVSVHPQSYKYLIPAATSQAFAPLKLFANELPNNSKDIDDGKFHISDLDTITAEDLDTRRKVFVDVFQKPVVKNLNSLVKEGGEVGREANSCMTIIDNLEQELKKVAEDE